MCCTTRAPSCFAARMREILRCVPPRRGVASCPYRLRLSRSPARRWAACSPERHAPDLPISSHLRRAKCVAKRAARSAWGWAYHRRPSPIPATGRPSPIPATACVPHGRVRLATECGTSCNA
eukprot:3386452-Prymnesium_polylepis.2